VSIRYALWAVRPPFKSEFAQYLFVFLKFVQSVIPTIEYDYTMDVELTANATEEEEKKT
jgi:hypothetical protein